MPRVFAFVIFLAAALLFVVQPMIGKMLLPYWGGAPSVWNTCMVFFQAALLGGYAYAHAVASRPSSVVLFGHLLLAALPVFLLPVAISQDSASTYRNYPTWGLFTALLLSIGLPFFVIASTSPLLQQWFARSGHPRARDPYFLYASSNAGSLIALAAYPFLIEPTLTLPQQSLVWTWGYVVFVVAIAVCGLTARRRQSSVCPSPRLTEAPAESKAAPSGDAAPGVRRIARWTLLAFAPSSLLLGVTGYLTTNLTPMPLLWALPLGLYLTSFIFVFAARPPLPHRPLCLSLPMCVLLLLILMLSGATELRGLPVGMLLGLHLVVFFVVSMVCHGELARDRPPPEGLTSFYLWMSVGGVLGGVFNGLLAPMVFRSAGLMEYPLVLALGCLACPARKKVEDGGKSARAWDLAFPVGVVVVVIALLKVVALIPGATAGPFHTAIVYGLPAIAVYSFVDRPLRFSLGLGALLFAGMWDASVFGTPLFAERNFFGYVRVTEVRTAEGEFHRLMHGETIHGAQRLDATDKEGRRMPLTYFHPTGPIGQVFQAPVAGFGSPRSVGVVGLGVGSLAYYARPDESWTFYEINPAVIKLARSPRLFEFLEQCRAGELHIESGDARLRLQEAPQHGFDIIVLDAFNSDAIPAHLLTREALELYLEKLSLSGVLAMHISNRYLDLEPILARSAASFDPPLAGASWRDEDLSAPEKQPSEWVVLARRESHLGPLIAKPWRRLDRHSQAPLWTDEFTYVLSALRLRRLRL